MKSEQHIIVGKLFFFSIRGEFVRILLNSVHTSNSFAIFRQKVFLNEPPLIIRKDEHE